MSATPQIKQVSIKNYWAFPALWLLTLCIYIATSRAGWVIDGVGFLYNMKHTGFWEFINRTYSSDQSFYQVLTSHYYLFYKLWGLNPWLWGLLYITLHSLNAYLFFIFSKKILSDTGIAKGGMIAISSAVIFTISPHISEIIVCRAYFHYLVALALILSILICVQQYQHRQDSRYIAATAVFFILAVFTLEIFYLIPVLVLCLAAYYRFALGFEKKQLRKTLLYFFIPQVILLGVYFLALVSVYKQFAPHRVEFEQGIIDYLSKLPKYLFHIVFLGRYFSAGVKDTVYAICNSWAALIVFYSLLTYVVVYSFRRLSTMGNYAKATFLFFSLGMLNLCFLMPLQFPGSALLVFYDRYVYFAAAFIYLLLALLAARFIQNKYVIIGLFCIYIDLNLYFTIQLNTYWIDSDKINNKLIRNFPNDESKTVLLLNNPENMNGAPMIGAQPEEMFKGMLEIYTGYAAKNTIYDVASYNMVTDYNGAHVKVINDTVISVMLNHTGTWWWYEGHGAKSYETPDYKVDVKSVGQRYDLILKQPSEKYLLLYSVGDTWKKVDMSKINVQQD